MSSTRKTFKTQIARNENRLWNHRLRHLLHQAVDLWGKARLDAAIEWEANNTPYPVDIFSEYTRTARPDQRTEPALQKAWEDAKTTAATSQACAEIRSTFSPQLQSKEELASLKERLTAVVAELDGPELDGPDLTAEQLNREGQLYIADLRAQMPATPPSLE